MRRKLMLLSLVLILFFIVPIASAKCGDFFCNSATAATGEDLSTCYDDCSESAFGHCILPTRSEPVNCLVGGQEIVILNYERVGCGPGGVLDAEIVSALFSEGSIKTQIGVERQLIGGSVYASFPSVGCSFDYSAVGYSLYLNAPCEDCNKVFASIETKQTEFTKEETNAISVNVVTEPQLLEPSVDYSVLDSLGEVVVTGIDGPTYLINGLYGKFGTFTIKATLRDNTQEFVIGEAETDIIIHECSSKLECDDGRFITTDFCSEEKVRVCGNKHWFSFLGFR